VIEERKRERIFAVQFFVVIYGATAILLRVLADGASAYPASSCC
jgi:hypothetical protein